MAGGTRGSRVGSVLRGVLFRNWRTKGLAFLLALLAWLYSYRGDVREQRKVMARLAVEAQLPPSLAVVACPVRRVAVTIRGSHWSLDRVVEDALSAALDVPVTGELHGATTANVEIRPQDIKGVPAGVVVEAITPRFVSVTVDRRVRRLMDVNVVMEGAPESGFQILGDPVPFPNKVWVTGPRIVVEKAPHIETRPLNVHGLSMERYHVIPGVRLARELAEPQGERRARVACEQETVDVGLRVVRAYDEQTAELPVYILAPPGFAYKLVLLEKTVRVPLRAPKGVMTPETLAKARAFVDATSFKPEAPVKAEVLFQLPPEVRRATEEPVQVTIDKVIPR